jgi:proteasome assembly chaperone (PAC2) family protein
MNIKKRVICGAAVGLILSLIIIGLFYLNINILENDVISFIIIAAGGLPVFIAGTLLGLGDIPTILSLVLYFVLLGGIFGYFKDNKKAITIISIVVILAQWVGYLKIEEELQSITEVVKSLVLGIFESVDK